MKRVDRVNEGARKVDKIGEDLEKGEIANVKLEEIGRTKEE